MEKKLRMTPAQVLEAAPAAVDHARRYVRDVEFSCEDATRSDPEFLVAVYSAAARAGATTLNLPDTVGYFMPNEFAALLTYLIAEVGHDVIWSVHTHDDLGMAVANAMAGIEAGARQVEVAMNGIGERAGNCALEEVVMALRTRASARMDTGIDTRQLMRMSRLVSRLTGYAVPPNKAIVGANAFAHEAGIHQHGVLMDRTTYEIMDPQDVGLAGSKIVLGKHSGRHAFFDALGELGFKVSREDGEHAFSRFKEMADKKARITDADLEAILFDGISTVEDAYELISIQVAGGTHMAPTATVRLLCDDVVIDESAIGDGMIDAVCGAIQRATEIDATLDSFSVSSVTGGIDALGDVTIVLSRGGIDGEPLQSVTGRGVSTDVVEASARAYLAAVNRLIRMKERAAEGAA